ncbi:MAG: universal stress protein UspA [Microbacterium sp.]|nr:universal stress protein UspA [Microbacterium sp.]
MPGTILVGVSEAPSSLGAREWAVRRARRTGERIRLFAVVGGAVGAVGEDEVVERLLTATRAGLERNAAELSASGVPVSVHVAAGDPVALLVEASSEASLLVIGGEPRAGGHRGRHGARIAAGAHCPVVVVPAGDGADAASRRGVVVGVDGSESSEAAIDFAATEAARLEEPLTLVAAWTPVIVPGDFGVYPDTYLRDLAGLSQSVVDRVRERLTGAHPELDVRTAVEEGDPATVIGAHAGTASLTVVGSHGRGAFARFLLGSVSEEVVAQLAGPTAVVR